jgi:phosphoglycolate phosphatase
MKAAIFDLDGTLLDSLADIAGAMNLMLGGRGYPVHEPDYYKEMIGDGMAKLVQRALPPEARTEELIAICTEEYRAQYENVWQLQTFPYDGTYDLLDTLRSRGVKLGVISNKAHQFTVPMCSHFFGEDRFDMVLGHRPDKERKPAPDGGLEMATAFGCAPADCAYIGDSGIDMEFAVNAGMIGVGVLWGFRSEQELRDCGAVQLVSAPAEIAALPWSV